MGIVEKKQGNNIYIEYAYRDGDKIRSVYCGKKGETETEENVKKARQRWYEMRLARLKAKMGSA